MKRKLDDNNDMKKFIDGMAYAMSVAYKCPRGKTAVKAINKEITTMRLVMENNMALSKKRIRDCKKKKSFNSAKEAEGRSIFFWKNNKKKFNSYKCGNCGKYHLMTEK